METRKPSVGLRCHTAVVRSLSEPAHDRCYDDRKRTSGTIYRPYVDRAMRVGKHYRDKHQKRVTYEWDYCQESRSEGNPKSDVAAGPT